jgi:hypothetical protein
VSPPVLSPLRPVGRGPAHPRGAGRRAAGCSGWRGATGPARRRCRRRARRPWSGRPGGSRWVRWGAARTCSTDRDRPRVRARCSGGQDAAEFGARKSGERGGAAGDPQAPACVVAAEDQCLGSGDGAEDAADDGLCGESGPDLAPGPAAGPVGLVAAFGHHPLDTGRGMLGEPGPGDGRIGRGGHQHQPVRELAPEEVLEQGPTGAVGEWPPQRRRGHHAEGLCRLAGRGRPTRRGGDHRPATGKADVRVGGGTCTDGATVAVREDGRSDPAEDRGG